jgi:hypothetical protein
VTARIYHEVEVQERKYAKARSQAMDSTGQVVQSRRGKSTMQTRTVRRRGLDPVQKLLFQKPPNARMVSKVTKPKRRGGKGRQSD